MKTTTKNEDKHKNKDNHKKWRRPQVKFLIQTKIIAMVTMVTDALGKPSKEKTEIVWSFANQGCYPMYYFHPQASSPHWFDR